MSGFVDAKLHEALADVSASDREKVLYTWHWMKQAVDGKAQIGFECKGGKKYLAIRSASSSESLTKSYVFRELNGCYEMENDIPMEY